MSKYASGEIRPAAHFDEEDRDAREQEGFEKLYRKQQGDDQSTRGDRPGDEKTEAAVD